MLYIGKDVDNLEYICDNHDCLVHHSYFVSKYDLSVNTFQDMVQREFIHEYPSDYIPKSKDLGHEIYTKVQAMRLEKKNLYKVLEPIGAKDNRVDGKSLPKRMIISKCPSSKNNYPDDIMTSTIKILSQGSMVDLRMVLKGFIYFINRDDDTDNALEFGSEVGHYVTFINLNDEQWLVLEYDKFYIVPDGYAYHFAKSGRMFAYEENSIEDTNESTKNLNDYYTEKIDMIFKRLNFLHSLHTSLQSTTLTLVDYLKSHLSGSNELNKLFTEEYLSKFGNQDDSHDQDRIRHNLMNLIETFYPVITKKIHCRHDYTTDEEIKDGI